MSDGLVTQPSILDNLHAGASFKKSASGVAAVLAPMVVDPKNPISSLSMGAQQFTIARDCRHGDPLIPAAILSELDGLAKAGVKRIMFETSGATKAEMEAVYPQIKGMSPAQADEFFDAGSNRIIEIIGRVVASKIVDIDTSDEIAWNNAYNEAQALLFKEEPEIQAGLNQIIRFRSSFMIQDVIEKFYADPPQINEDELRAHSDIFRSGNAETEADSQDIADVRIEMLIKARSLGIRIDYFGDEPGIEHRSNSEMLSMESDDVNTLKNAYIEANADMHVAFTEYMGAPNIRVYLNKIQERDGLDVEEQAQFMVDIGNHADKLGTYDDQIISLTEQSIHHADLETAARFSDDALDKRAQVYIDMAKGDKTLIVRGGGHFDNSVNLHADVDEYLDQKLRQQALQNGTLNDYVPSKQVALWPSRDVQIDFYQVIGGDIIPPDPAEVNYFIKDGVVEITDGYKGQYILTNDDNSLNNTLTQ